MTPTVLLRFVLVGAAFASLLTLPARSQAPKEKKCYALLIGVKDYSEDSKLRPLKYTENDVVELGKVLDGPDSSFKGNVRVMTCTRGKQDKDLAPTAANIKKAVRKLVADRRGSDTVLVALAGHGIQLEIR